MIAELVFAVAALGGIKALNDHAGESLLKKRGYKCPKCGGDSLRMKGTFRDYSNDITCKDCGHKFTIYRH